VVEAAPGPATAPTTNAAAIYREAFRAVPKLSKTERKAYSCQGNACGSRLRTAPLSADLLGPVDRSEPALGMLRKAADCRKCDWALEGKSATEALLPDLSEALLLMKLASVRARRNLERGQAKAAVDDLAAALTLARRVGAAGPLPCLIVQNAGDAMMSEVAAGHLPKLNAAELTGLAERLETIPSGTDLAGAIRRERQHVAKTHQGSPLLQSSLSYYSQAAELADLPPDQMSAKLKAMQNPVAGVLNPSLEQLARSCATAHLKMVMLKAAVQVSLKGKVKVKDFPDPYTGKPLEHEQLKQGFQLKSSLKIAGKPVTLVIGGK
jgi:hypothetical protein